jgi:antitoxin component HigA of HigAB toxin-antitoxin module
VQIRPIKTRADHREALKAIDKLMGARPGTPDGDRLDVLTVLVERYEEQVDAIEPPDPIEALRYHMESRGMSAVNGNRGTVSIRTIPMTDKRP